MKTSFEPTNKPQLYLRQPLGVFYARLYLEGKTKWVSLKTSNKTVAKVELAKLLQSHYAVRDAEDSTRKGNATIGQLAEIYLRDVAVDTDLKPKSKKYRRTTIDCLFRSWPGIDKRIPAKVSESECREWAARFHESFSETLYNNTVDSLRHIFGLAIDRGMITRNPAAAVSKIQVPQKKLELPSAEQFRQIVEHVRGAGTANSQGCADLIEFLAYSGCRLSEAMGVRWQDVDRTNGRIYIAPGKNSQCRHIPIIGAMDELLDRISSDPRWVRSEKRKNGDFVMSVQRCEESLTSACTAVGAKRITHHDLRHLYATRCIEAGVDIPTVSRWLGHVDGGALAMRVYGHLRDSHSQEMAAKVNF